MSKIEKSGIVVFQRNSNSKCVCCPNGEGGHIYSRYIEWNERDKHGNRVTEADFIYNFLLNSVVEGKTVKLTIETVDE